jgi:pyrroline-5-carboxylate reductase
MGNALIGGLLRSGWIEPRELAVSEAREHGRDELMHRYPEVLVTAGPTPADAAVLAVKPADAEAGMAIVVESGVTRMVSIAAGVAIARLQEWAGEGVAVLRAMPNMPAVLGAGATAVAGGPSASEEDLAWAEAVLSCFGVVARVPERLLDAVTGLSGSGPAYVFLLAEAMIDAGVEQGIDREVSRILVNHTLLGAARLLVETGEPPETLRAAVTSPGGTTAAGLRVLERNAVRAAVLDAVAAATARSRRLGRPARPKHASGPSGRPDR